MSKPTKLQQAILVDVAHELGNISPVALWEEYCKKHNHNPNDTEEFENELRKIIIEKENEARNGTLDPPLLMTWQDLYNCDVELEEVDCDDYGDPTWKWHAVWRFNGQEIWDDYFVELPDEARLDNVLIEAVYAGDIEIRERNNSDDN